MGVISQARQSHQDHHIDAPTRFRHAKAPLGSAPEQAIPLLQPR